MSEKYVIVCDIGTTTIKAAVVSITGNIIAKSLKESKLYYPQPGWVEQNPDEMYSSTIETMKLAIQKSKISSLNIIALALSGQMAGIIGIDEDWNAVTHYDSWLDSRCKSYVEQLKSKNEEKYIEKCGMPVTIAHAAKILWWKNEKPNIYKNIAKFVVPASYISGKLAGLKGKDAFIDYTYLHFTGLYDAKKTIWSEEMGNLLGINLDKMPIIVNPWDVIGELTKKGAKECGLDAGIPIIAGSGDAAASFLGAGLGETGLLVDLAGTASLLACCVDDFKPDIKNKTLIFPKAVQPGYWCPHAYIGGGGLCLRWFRDTFAKEEKEKASCKGVSAYEILDKRAKQVDPGSDGLIFIPHLAGRTYPSDSRVKGTWIGFSWSHNKAHFYRSILESIAYEYRYYLKIIKRLFPEMKYSEVRVIGGGSKSRLWNQIKADVLGLPYVQINEEDVSLIGLTMIAAKGIGLIKSINDGSKKNIKITNIYRPRKDFTQYYKSFAEVYENIFLDFAQTFTNITKIENLSIPTTKK